MKPEDCPKLNECAKVKMVLDKDLLDFQYQDAVREVCAKCEGVKPGWIEAETYELVKSLVPICCVDLIVHRGDQVLLCCRKNEPDKGRWALPGGRVLKGETLEEAVRRKAMEELGIEVTIERQVGTYNVILERLHAISVAFLVTMEGDAPIKLDSQHSGYKWISTIDSVDIPYVAQAIRDSRVLAM